MPLLLPNTVTQAWKAVTPIALGRHETTDKPALQPYFDKGRLSPKSNQTYKISPKKTAEPTPPKTPNELSAINIANKASQKSIKTLSIPTASISSEQELSLNYPSISPISGFSVNNTSTDYITQTPFSTRYLSYMLEEPIRILKEILSTKSLLLNLHMDTLNNCTSTDLANPVVYKELYDTAKVKAACSSFVTQNEIGAPSLETRQAMAVTQKTIELQLKTLIKLLHFNALLLHYPEVTIDLPQPEFTIENLYDAIDKTLALYKLMTIGIEHITDLNLRAASVTSHLTSSSPTETEQHSDESRPTSRETTKLKSSQPNTTVYLPSSKFTTDMDSLPNTVNQSAISTSTTRTTKPAIKHTRIESKHPARYIHLPLTNKLAENAPYTRIHKPTPKREARLITAPTQISTILNIKPNANHTPNAYQKHLHELYLSIEKGLHFFRHYPLYKFTSTVLDLVQCSQRDIALRDKIQSLIDIATKRTPPKSWHFFSCSSRSQPSDLDSFCGMLRNLNLDKVDLNTVHRFDEGLLKITPAIVYYDTLIRHHPLG